MKKIQQISATLNAISNTKFIIIYVLLVLLTCLLYCFHGIDMTDSGFCLTGYQQIFNHPNSVESMFYIYDTLIIGGLWEKCFAGLGIIGYKILAALFIVAISVMVYILLHKVVNRWIILFCTILLITTKQYFVFHYNTSSALLAIIIAYFIYKALLSQKTWLMMVAGFVLGISVFARFPNIALSGLILILIPFYFHTKNLSLTLHLLLFAFGGFLLGIVANILLVVALGHTDYMLNMFNTTLSLLSTSDSTHNLPQMLRTYRNSYLKVILVSFPIVFYPFLCYLIDRYESRKVLKITLLVLINLIFCSVLSATYQLRNIIILHAFCCIVFVYVFIKRNYQETNTLYLIGLAFLIMFLFPFGSDGGMYNVGVNCLFLSFPLAVGLVWNQLSDKSIFCISLKATIVTAICILLLISTIYSLRSSYRDTGSILKKTAMVSQTGMYTTFTNPEKASALDELLKTVNPYITSETELLAYPSIPMVNYLTNTKPYLNGAWIGILNLATFEHNLQVAEQTKQLPIIVIAKAPDVRWFVPNKEWKTINDCDDWHPSIKEKNCLVQSFINNHSYSITLDNELFQVLIPNTMSK